MKNSNLKVALIQQRSLQNYKNNIKKSLQLIKKAVSQDARIICVQELFLSDYFCKTYDEAFFELAETVPGPTTETFQQVAAENEVVLLCSVFEKQGPLYYNTLAVIDADGSYLGKYRKMHIPDDPGFYEKYYFTPGDLGYKMFQTQYGCIGTLICWDQWFPEAARLTAMKGADLLVYPTAIATLEQETDQQKQHYHEAWRTIQRSHAIANGCYVASVNRVGIEDRMSFWGGSFVADPLGNVIAEAGDDEQVLVTECNLDRMNEIRHEWPFFRDRRADSYEGITRKWLEG